MNENRSNFSFAVGLAVLVIMVFVVLAFFLGWNN